MYVITNHVQDIILGNWHAWQDALSRAEVVCVHAHVNTSVCAFAVARLVSIREVIAIVGRASISVITLQLMHRQLVPLCKHGRKSAIQWKNPYALLVFKRSQQIQTDFDKVVRTLDPWDGRCLMQPWPFPLVLYSPQKGAMKNKKKDGCQPHTGSGLTSRSLLSSYHQ